MIRSLATRDSDSARDMRPVCAAGIALVKSFESLALRAYCDGSGVWTLGWGHTAGVQRGDVCTVHHAERLLSQDCAAACAALAHVLDAHVDTLNDNQYAALVSFVFNVGGRAFAASTLAARIRAGALDDVPEQLRRWVHDHTGRVERGLVARRDAEIRLWNTPTEREETTRHDDAQTLVGSGGAAAGGARSTRSDD